MKRRLLVAIASSLFATSSLADVVRGFVEAITISGDKQLPIPTEGFKPAEAVPIAPTELFKLVVTLLDDARVPIAQENRESGRITTDYIAGPTYFTALGLLGSNTVRYKYLISIREHSKGSQLRVTAFLESSGNTVQSWRDVGSSNKEIVEALQNALIEEVEKRASGKK